MSGRSFELWSNQPGLQFYSGNFLDGTVVGKSGHIYREGDAIVLEPQQFPDTPNHPEFGSVRLVFAGVDDRAAGAARSPPPGGGLDPVTATFPLRQAA